MSHIITTVQLSASRKFHLSFSFLSVSRPLMEILLSQIIRPSSENALSTEPHCNQTIPCSLPYADLKSTDRAQLDGKCINIEHAEASIRRPRTLETMFALNSEKPPYPELLDMSLAVSLSICKVTSGSFAIENVLAIMQYPWINVLLFTEQV